MGRIIAKQCLLVAGGKYLNVFICITTMAHGGWQVSLRRIPEAISSLVPILGLITLVILIALIFGNRTDIYHWLDKEAVNNDKILYGKKASLVRGSSSYFQ